MSLDLSSKLVIGISSRALFDLETENSIFERDGEDAYAEFQLAHEDDILKPGTAFSVIKGLLELNEQVDGDGGVEVVIMSRNSADVSVRIYKSIEHYGLAITRGVFTKGRSLSHYLEAFKVDLFLSRMSEDVQAAIDAGYASALIYDPPELQEETAKGVNIAFDADAVLFSETSEYIYKTEGLEAFIEHEQKNASNPLEAGPFARFLYALSHLQSQLPHQHPGLRIAIVTARDSTSHERVVRTLRAWDIRIDECFFLGGVKKDEVLQAFGAHIFFDDQHRHLSDASKRVPSGRVPYKTDSPMSEIENL